MAGIPADGNSSSSKSLLWMMIALFAGLGVLLGGGMLLAGRVVRSLSFSAVSSKDIIHTPAGSFRLEKENQVGPSLAVYPRASLVLPGENAVPEAIKEAQSGMNKATYHTTDTREFVDGWYQKHLSPEFLRHDAGDKPLPDIFRDARVSGDDIAFVAERGRQVRIVALSLDSTGTRIFLIRYDKPAAQ
jgi:hypothetical protein